MYFELCYLNFRTQICINFNIFEVAKINETAAVSHDDAEDVDCDFFNVCANTGFFCVFSRT